LIGGQRPLTARASFSPSIEPGIWISVKNQRDVAASLQNFDRFIGITGFKDLKPGGGDHIDRVHSQQKLILDDQHHGSL